MDLKVLSTSTSSPSLLLRRASLQLLKNGLNHESAMRPLRSLNGFSCKACALGQAGALPPSERKQSTLPHLLGHFKASHAEYPGLDWRKDTSPQHGARWKNNGPDVCARATAPVEEMNELVSEV